MLEGQMDKVIAIDGACRRGGKPDCSAAGACFILDIEDNLVCQGRLAYQYEKESSSQRGELIGLYLALEHLIETHYQAVIITDSEYIYNAMTQRWIPIWMSRNWQTTAGTDVKNQDIWKCIWKDLIFLQDQPVTFYHTKGHLLSVGVKTTEKLLQQDDSGLTLYNYALDKREISQDRLEHAKQVSIKNNGFKLPYDIMKMYAAMNLVADAAANQCLDNQEKAQWANVLKQ